MVIVIKTGTPEAAIRQLLAQLAAQNVKGGCVAGPDGILLPLVGDTWRLDPNMLQGLPYVQEVRRLTPAYRLAGRAAHPANTVVAVGDAKIGEKFCMIAGPCAVESAPQMAAVAQSVKESGAQLLRGGAFKPRTSPYTFQGLEKAGLDLLVQAGRDEGLPVVTEITDISQLDLLADVDVLQVGARNMQNYALLKALGQLRRPVLLKRGLSATVEEFLLAAEYLLSGGNEQVILCERGVRSGVSAARAALDVSAIPVLKRATHLPVLVDPSHAAGRSELVLPLALAAVLNKYVESLYQNTFFIGFAFLMTGVLLFAADRMGHGNKNERGATLGDAVVVGLAQMIAVVPGLSRSGTTISAGLLRGFGRNFAVKFSFLLSIPAVLGANLVSLVKAFAVGVDWSMAPKYLVGVLVAFVSGYFAIYLLRMIVQRGKFGGFAYYCWGAGLVTLILSLTV